MHAEVQRYYGEVLSSTDDLKTSACCTADAPPRYLRDALGQIHDEVLTRYYGCGLVLPEALDGADVLDLGCGAGRDVYVLSQLAGEDGFVVGVDMTPEQLDVARRHRDYHAEQFGHARSNVEFIEGNIERLGETGLDRRPLRRDRVELRHQSRHRQTGGARRRLATAEAGRRAVLRRHLRRSPHSGRAAGRSGAVRRMPVRRAVLERLSRHRAPCRIRGSATRRRPPGRRNRRVAGRARWRYSLLLGDLQVVQAAGARGGERRLWPDGVLSRDAPAPSRALDVSTRRPCSRRASMFRSAATRAHVDRIASRPAFRCSWRYRLPRGTVRRWPASGSMPFDIDEKAAVGGCC